jgi:predicted GTPase
MQYECDERNKSGSALCFKHSREFQAGKKIFCDSGLILWKGGNRAMKKMKSKGKKVVFWANRNGKRVKVCFTKKKRA